MEQHFAPLKRRALRPLTPVPWVEACRAGDEVAVHWPRAALAGANALPERGVVLGVSPAGWALVQLYAGGARRPLYKECFFMKGRPHE